MSQIDLTSAKVNHVVDMVGCCGESRSLTLALQSSDIDSVDVSNAPVDAGHLDAFLTDANCDQLFAAPYNGAGTAMPLCRVFIGPIAAGTVGSRQSVPQGTYRLIVQAWDSNTDPLQFDATVGVYSSDCQLRGTVGPTL
jgi:hypothetical protein